MDNNKHNQHDTHQPHQHAATENHDHQGSKEHDDPLGHDKHAGHHTEDFLKRFWISGNYSSRVAALANDSIVAWL